MAILRLVAVAALFLGLLAGAAAMAEEDRSGASPPPPPAAAVPYYVAHGGEARGPMSLDLMLADIAAGEILPWTPVWKPGLSAWIRAGELPELADALADAAPRPPPPPPEPPPPPQEPPAETILFTADGAEVRGPFTEAEIEAAIAAGEVTRETLIWRSGAQSWVAAWDDPELRGLFSSRPPEIPLAEAMRQLMVGAWEFETDFGHGMVARSTLEFRGDMTFSGFVTLTVSGAAASTNPVTGAWSVAGAGDGRFALTLSPSAGAPGTVQLRVVDRDNLVNETDGGTAHRVGTG